MDRYCIYEGCSGGKTCKNPYRVQTESCAYEYVAEHFPEEFRWKGEGPPPKRWQVGNTTVYRSYSDYCD